MSIEHKTTHESEVEGLQLEQFKDATNISALIGVYVNEVQNIENSIFDVRSAYWLDYAIGAQLDAVGDIVGLGRAGLSDAVYRNLLRMQIVANGSSGSIAELLRVFELYDDPAVSYREWYNACVVFTALTASADAERVKYFLDLTRSSGVNLQIIFNEVTASVFRFGSSVSPVTGATATGFAATGSSTGGHLLGVY